MTRHYRADSLTTLYDFFLNMGVKMPEGFSLWLIDCLANSDSDPCYSVWTELNHQFEANKPSRMYLKDRLQLNEQRIAQHLGYHLGPTYIQNENNILIDWNDTFRTRFSKVLNFGERTLTLVPKSAPTIREFLNLEYAEHPTILGDTIQFTIQTDQVLTEDDLCNLRIWPADRYDQHWGHRLRPFEVISYDSNTGILVIQMPIWIAVKRERYLFFDLPGAKEITSINGCDPDTYIDDINLYIISYEYPHGYVTLKRELCNTCAANGVTLCPACTNIKLPFCVMPIDPENGEFKIKPLVFDSDYDRFVPADFSSCCEWISTILNDNCESCEGCTNCCNQCKQYCDPCNKKEPLYISYSYLSGCSDYPYKSCCFEDDVVCYPQAVWALVASELISCDCAPCSTHSIEMYSTPVYDISQNVRTGIFTKIFNNNFMFRFGYTFGAVEASQILIDVDKRKEYVII